MSFKVLPGDDRVFFFRENTVNLYERSGTMNKYHYHTSEIMQAAKLRKAGDHVLLSGTVYTARDAAHKCMQIQMEHGAPLPFPMENAVIYYAGPTPAPPGMAIGSCGPTTSGRMDEFTPQLLDAGLKAMIGKGKRSAAVVEAMKRNEALYLCAIGGAGALAAKCITKCEIIAYAHLGCESIKKLEFVNFPLIVAIDCKGNSVFKE